MSSAIASSWPSTMPAQQRRLRRRQTDAEARAARVLALSSAPDIPPRCRPVADQSLDNDRSVRAAPASGRGRRDPARRRGRSARTIAADVAPPAVTGRRATRRTATHLAARPRSAARACRPTGHSRAPTIRAAAPGRRAPVRPDAKRLEHDGVRLDRRPIRAASRPGPSASHAPRRRARAPSTANAASTAERPAGERRDRGPSGRGERARGVSSRPQRTPKGRGGADAAALRSRRRQRAARGECRRPRLALTASAPPGATPVGPLRCRAPPRAPPSNRSRRALPQVEDRWARPDRSRSRRRAARASPC